ncbi:hypothetical protein SESBI_23900, partial [Sesbania bispinosa]
MASNRQRFFKKRIPQEFLEWKRCLLVVAAAGVRSESRERQAELLETHHVAENTSQTTLFHGYCLFGWKDSERMDVFD